MSTQRRCQAGTVLEGPIRRHENKSCGGVNVSGTCAPRSSYTMVCALCSSFRALTCGVCRCVHRSRGPCWCASCVSLLGGPLQRTHCEQVRVTRARADEIAVAHTRGVCYLTCAPRASPRGGLRAMTVDCTPRGANGRISCRLAVH